MTPEELIYQSAYQSNIIPLTSDCNVSCIFCSHRQNPPGVRVCRISPRTLKQVEETLSFVSAGNKIVIGEAATRIIEGEPLTHPQFSEIMSLIRTSFPSTVIQVTTNGSLLDSEMAKFLARLGGIEVNLSLNSSCIAVRERLMSDRRAALAVDAARLLKGAGVTFHGSVVAMPHITGWDDLGTTVDFLSDNGARTIRVFLPGFTRLAPGHLRFGPELWKELTAYVESRFAQNEVPVMVEPPVVQNLRAIVKGVMKGSPAALAGVQRDDVIVAVDSRACKSRVDAFHRVKKGGPIVIRVQRRDSNSGWTESDLRINKVPGQTSGLVMDYDIDGQYAEQIRRAVVRYGRVVLLASVLGAPVLRQVLNQEGLAGRVETVIVENRFFGGSIMAAGLLTVQDFLSALEGFLSRVKDNRTVPTACLLPSVAFDGQGRDLIGESCLKISEKTGIRVEII